MRPTAILPILCSVAALVLSFLCLFAGHKKDFMEDYHLITLNTSRIGYNLVDTVSNGDNPVSDLLSSLPQDIQNTVNQVAGDVAQVLGVDDFYSLHLLDYCYGDYTPGPLPNATLSSSDIHKNVTACSAPKAAYKFDPEAIIDQKLKESGLAITLQDLQWPEDIQRGIDALHAVQVTAFILYCIAIGLIFISLVSAVPALFAMGRLAACLNLLVATCAFLAIGLASALITAFLVKGVGIINQYGAQIGLQASRGNKFLALTWTATALMFIALVLWIFETCIGHRRHKASYTPKHG